MPANPNLPKGIAELTRTDTQKIFCNVSNVCNLIPNYDVDSQAYLYSVIRFVDGTEHNVTETVTEIWDAWK